MTPQTGKQLRVAAAHFEAGRFDKAKSICGALLDDQPQDIEARHLLALVERKLGNSDHAGALFLKCLEMAPDRADIRANFGNLKRANGEPNAAISEYRQALAADSGFRPARIALARTLNDIGEYTEAADECRVLLEKDVKDAEAWGALGTAFRGLEEDLECESAFHRAIALRSGYGAAHHNLGAFLADHSRHEEALEQLRLAADAGVRGSELLHNLASSLAGLSRFDEAEDLLMQATEAMPLDIDLHRLLARLRFMRGEDEWDTAIKSASASLPENASLRIAHSQLLRAAGDFDRAFSVLEPLKNDESVANSLNAELAGLHQEAGNYAEALECARAVVGDRQDYDEAIDLIIDPLMSLGRADEAMPYIELGRSEAPLNQWYVAMEATAARLLGEERYAFIYDYDRLVRPYKIEAPLGWSSTADFRRDLNATLLERHKFRAQPLDQSLRYGTQTPRGLLGDPHPVIQAFLKALLEPIAAYRREIGSHTQHPMTVRNRGNIKMTGCWSVRLQKNGYHVNHVHPEGWISSAYYAEVPGEVADSEHHRGWIKFGEPRFPVPGATAGKYVQPEAGSLVLFPSYMWHGTVPITGDEPRMSVAFDAICVGD